MKMKIGALKGLGLSALLALGSLVFAAGTPAPAGGTPSGAAGDAGKYIGAEKCKNCHEAKSKGSQFSAWKATKHAHAFDVLATDEAKKTAKAKGIDDPQKADACLKCHVTAFGAPAASLAKGFPVNLGVQCETCHGPGEKHFKARMAAAGEEDAGSEWVEVPDDEIVKSPTAKTCLACHNEESPSFKPFCFKKRSHEIQHLDPRRKRTAEELKAMQCGCAECTCKQGECGDHHGGQK